MLRLTHLRTRRDFSRPITRYGVIPLRSAGARRSVERSETNASTNERAVRGRNKNCRRSPTGERKKEPFDSEHFPFRPNVGPPPPPLPPPATTIVAARSRSLTTTIDDATTTLPRRRHRSPWLLPITIAIAITIAVVAVCRVNYRQCEK